MCSSTIPNSIYETKRNLRILSLGYETIHVYKYDCVLYWKEFFDLQHCPTCSESQYKEGSADIRWHRDKRVKTDDVLRHPADAEGWKHIDYEFPDFSSDPQNMHLGLASNRSPGRKIDMYLLPMIEELKEFWNFWVRTYDSLIDDKLSFGIRGRISFMGHRCYLLENHVWSKSRQHNGKEEVELLQ
ncbi:uncharacterized protein E5676_scaffold108G001290 [Cucumis melo var. makuwa]|uniref:Uncharacterized protein n=1 Tax=Cucumis melo var. makuwa TaxID=1194695 RepID=A0A5A7TM94_CUCMM|nr:uncharacterized protein E6C27_scaffold44G004240 [Cucumis melo var. makuwa]TYK05309.1 uncharacterized protein E5676_scaffold108G001290 [Cucumis melo var. makuwa]